MKITRFYRDERGLTGSEKALFALLSLGILILVIRVIMGGANSASDESYKMLTQQGGGGPGSQTIAGNPGGGGGGTTGATARTVATPLPTGGSDLDYDGALTGANGASYAPDTPLNQIPPVMPGNGQSNGETIIYVNGISTSRDAHQSSLQHVADKTGSQVIGVYNATDGMVKDVVQSLGDKVDIGTNRAVDSVADNVYEQLAAGKTVHLMGHSQGGLILSRALTDVRNRLMLEDGMTREEAEAALSRVTVETFGAAATSYPDGPRYVHYINRLDPVPGAFGLGPVGSIGAGRGAKIVRFNELNGGISVGWRWPPVSVDAPDPHGFEAVYLPRREPID